MNSIGIVASHNNMNSEGKREEATFMIKIIMFMFLVTSLFADNNRDLLNQLSFIEELPLALSPLSSTFEIVSNYYEGIMQELRGLGVHRVSPSRLNVIGKILCADANLLFDKAQALGGDESRNTHFTWLHWMTELVKHETTDVDCLQFHRYYVLNWEPKFFHWPLMGKDVTRLLQSMIEQNDTEWETFWVNPIVGGSYYAANAAIPPISR